MGKRAAGSVLDAEGRLGSDFESNRISARRIRAAAHGRTCKALPENLVVLKPRDSRGAALCLRD
jgi:hypothetical protein